MKTRIESRITPSNVLLFRMRCDACNRNGAWLTNLTDAERSADLHERSEHAQKVSA